MTLNLTETMALFAARPWRADSLSDPGPALAVPTMLSEEEGRLYTWLGARWATGEGEVVDLGAFAGGSAARLAEGLTRGSSGALVHAFDRFEADERAKTRHLYRAGIAPFTGSDIMPLVRRLLEPWETRITFHQGDIATAAWTGEPIEILVIDAAKSAAVADCIAATFFPVLIPGRSIVVQQDYLHPPTPWLAAQMAVLAGCFRPLAYLAPTSMVFLCTSRATSAALEKARVANLDDAALRKLIRKAGGLSKSLVRRGPFVRLVKQTLQSPGARSAAAVRRGVTKTGTPRG
jgi:hypothetical protein